MMKSSELTKEENQEPIQLTKPINIGNRMRTSGTATEEEQRLGTWRFRELYLNNSNSVLNDPESTARTLGTHSQKVPRILEHLGNMELLKDNQLNEWISEPDQELLETQQKKNFAPGTWKFRARNQNNSNLVLNDPKSVARTVGTYY